jgi:hypothetical protein
MMENNRSIRIKRLMDKIRGTSELSQIVIFSGKDPENAQMYWIDEQPYNPDEFEKIMEHYPAGSTIVFLPAKNETIE